MSKVVDFLALPDISSITKEIYINDRIGSFTIKPMTSKQHSNYQNRCKGKTTKDGTAFDGAKFNLLIVAGQTIEPDFANADLLSKAGCATASDFIEMKLLPGEISELAEQIIILSGFNTDINEDVEEAKN